MVPSCRGCLQKRSNHTVKNQIRPHRPEDYGLGTWPDHGFCYLLRNPLRGVKGQACLLVYSIKLAKGFQTDSSPWAGRPPPYCSHGGHVGPSPRGQKPGCLFQGLFLERLPVKMRDHLVSREFKNPSEMALYANSLWDARKAVPTDHLLAAVSTSSSSPSHGRAQDHRSPSPNCRSQAQVHQTLSVISTNILVLQPTIVALLAVSRETPEPTGGGKI